MQRALTITPGSGTGKGRDRPPRDGQLTALDAIVRKHDLRAPDTSRWSQADVRTVLRALTPSTTGDDEAGLM